MVSARCDEIIQRHSLLQHPFYRAWSDGCLPVPALREYSRLYGSFIREIGQGWTAAGHTAIARIEERHAAVWEQSFAGGLGTTVTAPDVDEVSHLVEASRELFSDRPSALGALYAFEAQQPATSRAKLEGLNTHYRTLPRSCGEYFALHANDDAEPALLAEALETLSREEAERAIAACERMCRSLYDALSGIDRVTHASC